MEVKRLYFWLCWLFAALWELPLVAASRATLCFGVLASHCGAFPFTATAPLPACKYRKEADGWEKESLPQLCQ